MFKIHKTSKYIDLTLKGLQKSANHRKPRSLSKHSAIQQQIPAHSKVVEPQTQNRK
jgi:hypothetical protein